MRRRILQGIRSAVRNGAGSQQLTRRKGDGRALPFALPSGHANRPHAFALPNKISDIDASHVRETQDANLCWDVPVARPSMDGRFPDACGNFGG